MALGSAGRTGCRVRSRRRRPRPVHRTRGSLRRPLPDHGDLTGKGSVMNLIGELHRSSIVTPIVQLSLDLTNIEEATATARVAVDCGIDWLEIGTPLLLAEGL